MNENATNVQIKPLNSLRKAKTTLIWMKSVSLETKNKKMRAIESKL